MTMPRDLPRICPVCATAAGYLSTPVLWSELTQAWKLTPAEVLVLDARDAVSCRACGSKLRTMTLARAVMTALGSSQPFKNLRLRPWLRILELNDCDTLRPLMRRRHMPFKVSGDYPSVDMQELPYADDTFDLVLHGDTLEHVLDPVKALRECRRVLKLGSPLCYTVPVVVGRSTRRRDDLPASYHGTEADPQYLVHTEYGDDFWRQPLSAGFDTIQVISLGYPSSFALICR